MTSRQRTCCGVVIMVGALAALTTAAFQAAGQASAAQPAARAEQVGPRYGSDGALLMPDDYRRWVFVGSSLGLSYGEGQGGAEMFHETLMEPTAYEHFVDTGVFREGTMLALILHGTGESVLPARRGRFAGEVRAVEMAVKDTSHRTEGWAYYNFGGRNGLRSTAQALPKESCYTCHLEHAKRDNVFLQFYPLLAEAAHLTAAVTSSTSPANVASASQTPPSATSRETAVSLALTGLDPVMLVDGREEMGKPEIVATHEAYRYQFVSEPNRVRFAADPARFSIQNSTCLVVSGAAVDPRLFAVHEKRIYAFATSDCIDRFKSRPSDFIPRDK